VSARTVVCKGVAGVGAVVLVALVVVGAHAWHYASPLAVPYGWCRLRACSAAAPSPLCNLRQALWPECTLSINVQCLALGTAHVDRQLRNSERTDSAEWTVVLGDRAWEQCKGEARLRYSNGAHLARNTQRVTELCLAAAELSVQLCNGASLHTTCST
jgi:hypothetical protein